jgi:F-type H+-transporting ATPase subunit b
MPQFDFGNVFLPQLFWLAVFFVALYFGIVRPTLPKLGRVMDERSGKIDADLAAAHAAKEAADEIGEAYRQDLERHRETVRVTLAEAKTQAALAREKRLAAENARADAHVAEAEARIAAAREQAGNSLRAVASDSARAIVAKLTGAEPAGEEAAAAVDEALARA